MPQNRVPNLRLHKASGRAFVELNGHRVYLCKWDHPERNTKYHATLAQWERAGRRFPFDVPTPKPPQNDVAVIEVCAAFFEYAQAYYVHKDGTPNKQITRVKSAMKGVRELFADIPAVDFGPLKLDAVRARWIYKGLSRSTINSMTSIVKLAFRWGAAKEMIPASVYHGLVTLDGLKAGRTQAKEAEPVRPVLTAHIEAVKPFVSRQVWAMIQLQLLTACRPGEIVGLKNDGTVNRTGKVWTAVLVAHKNAYRGQERTLLFGPQAQEVLRPWLLERPIGGYLFSPREAEAERYAKAESHRRQDQMPNPKKTGRTLNDNYTVVGYAQAVRRACVKAGIPPWSPGQIRHTAATRIRQEFGLEAAQVSLGHSKADVTQRYAEVNHDRALTVFEQIG